MAEQATQAHPGIATSRRAIAICWDGSTGEHSLRDTGIGAIGRIPWGSHMCMFCETKEDLLDSALSFFRPALAARESCMWVVSQPLDMDDALRALRDAAPDLDARRRAGQFEIVAGTEWYYPGGKFDRDAVIAAWHARVDRAEASGLEGLRAWANPLWRNLNMWPNINEYEHALDGMLNRRRMILLCAYTTDLSTSDDVLEVASSHQMLIARRRGKWELLRTAATAGAKKEIEVFNGDLDALPERLAADESVTERERVVLGQIVKGLSSKEAARVLGISPRTVEFHRANLMRKFGARNSADLVRKVYGRNGTPGA